MTPESLCPCCSGKNYNDCCEPIHLKQNSVSTAEALMRSRYSAYALNNAAYLMNSTHLSTRTQYSITSIKKFAMENSWQKLEIVATEKGQENDTTGIVEFKAYYIDKNNTPQIHHEKSRFRKESGKWFFVDGIVF